MKKKMRKILVTALVVTIIMQYTGIISYAAEDFTSKGIMIEREDVPHEEAIKDDTYIPSLAEKVSMNKERSASWEAWGVMGTQYWSGGNYGAKPIGYSQHVDANGNVLDTYHYTRTYIGSLLKMGDSGRKWGTGCVKAEGGFVVDDYWEDHIHYVKYGTED